MPKINPILDARSLTDYRPDCVIEQNYMKRLNVSNNRDFKNALMNNGTQMMISNSKTIAAQMAALHSKDKF